MALIKSAQDIKHLRSAGKFLGEVLRDAAAAAVAGTVLTDLDQFIDKAIRERNCRPAFLGYDGFTHSSCLSLNDQVVHGIPDHRSLKEGDVLGIDVGLWYEGVCVDAAVTVGVGTITQSAQHLLDGTQAAIRAGIAAIKPYRRIGAISEAVQTVAEHNGLGIVRGYTGHGVGHHLHEEPEVPNQGRSSDGILLKKGMVLAIEPMLTLGKGEVYTEMDGWAVTTHDHSLAAQFEHTVLVTDRGAEILTHA